MRSIALIVLMFACTSNAPQPATAVPPPTLPAQPNGFVPVAVDMPAGGRRPPQPATCAACPSGECDIAFTKWCAAKPEPSARDWWVCAPKRDEVRADGCPARIASPALPCSGNQHCVYSRCPGSVIGFDDIAYCVNGAWQVMSED